MKFEKEGISTDGWYKYLSRTKMAGRNNNKEDTTQRGDDGQEQ
jgi:hypothetical protein